jgi:hypothetical protein
MASHMPLKCVYLATKATFSSRLSTLFLLSLRLGVCLMFALKELLEFPGWNFRLAQVARFSAETKERRRLNGCSNGILNFDSAISNFESILLAVISRCMLHSLSLKHPKKR